MYDFKIYVLCAITAAAEKCAEQKKGISIRDGA